MNDARIQAIQQMQRMQREATGQQTAPQGKSEVSFGSMLKQYVNDVNDMQADATQQIRRSIAGEDVDAHTVMLAVEKAGVAFDMVMQVRNKMLEAYKEIVKTGV